MMNKLPKLDEKDYLNLTCEVERAPGDSVRICESYARGIRLTTSSRN